MVAAVLKSARIGPNVFWDSIIFFIFQMAIGHHLEFLKSHNFYSLRESGGPRHVIMPNFAKINQSVAEILQFSSFSKWLPPSWIFEIVKFYWLTGSGGLRGITMPNFVNVSQSTVKLLQFFSRWGHLPSWTYLGHIGPPTEYMVVSITVQNLDMIVSIKQTNVSIFGTFGGKTSFTP